MNASSNLSFSQVQATGLERVTTSSSYHDKKPLYIVIQNCTFVIQVISTHVVEAVDYSVESDCASWRARKHDGCEYVWDAIRRTSDVE